MGRLKHGKTFRLVIEAEQAETVRKKSAPPSRPMADRRLKQPRRRPDFLADAQ